MDHKSSKLYFVAIIPPEPIFSEVMQIKQYVSEHFGSKAALKSPPHVTLHMPFGYREDREDQLVEFFEEQSKNRQSLDVIHDGFGCFEPRVVYVNVQPSDALKELRHSLVKAMRIKLKLDNAEYKDQPFHPHMTVAFRDLKKLQFGPAWSHFRVETFRAKWMCTSFCLLKHDGNSWHICREFHFQ